MTTIGQMLDFVQRNNVRRSKKIVTYAGHCSALEKRATTFIFTPDTDFVRRIYVRRSKKISNYAGHCPALSGVPSGSYDQMMMESQSPVKIFSVLSPSASFVCIVCG